MGVEGSWKENIIKILVRFLWKALRILSEIFLVMDNPGNERNVNVMIALTGMIERLVAYSWERPGRQS